MTGVAAGQDVASATLRALTDDPSLRLRGDRPFRGEQRLSARAPHLHGPADPAGTRGRVDAWALHARHTDPAVHAANLPTDPVAAMLFESLEQLRVESLVEWAGGRSNLRALHSTWVAAWTRSGALDSEAGMLIFTALQMAHLRLSGFEADPRVSDMIEAARFSLAPVLGADLRSLTRQRGDQRAFAVHARAMAESVAGLVDEAAPGDPAGASSRAHGLALLLEDLESADAPLVSARHSTVLAAAVDGYIVYTRDHDEEVGVTDLVRPAALDRFREELDGLVRASDLTISRVTRELRAVLETTEATFWQSGAEEGQIDGRALTRVVTSPNEPRVHRELTPERVVDTAVTVLLDCSGSMRAHVPTLLVALDALLRGLELADATSEVLGFSTRTWGGGRVVDDWRRAGRPSRPGRLNEQRHIVLVEQGASRRQARRGLSGLLREDLFREGIAGEAVEWATDRLRSHPTGRRILVVVSDGSPMDTATHGANDDQYLEHHLRQVVSEQTRRGGVEIVGLGIGGDAGVDLSPYFDRCSDVSSLDAAGVLRALVSLMGRP